MNSNVVIKSLVVFVIINFLGIACCGPFDDPGEFKVDDYALILQEDITDHTLPDRLLLLGDSVISDRLQLLLQPSTKFISDVTRQGGWTKAALACSPPSPVATQNFTSINVSSNADYVLSNDTIKAGESLTLS
jgi:hypothetical protein